MHHWHRLLQERVLQRPRKVLVGAQYDAFSTEKIKQLSSLPGLSGDLSVVWLLCLKKSRFQLLL